MPQKGKGKQAAKAGKPGRKGKYDEWLTEEGLLKIGAWSRDGLTQEDIAHNCGCSVSTFKEWVNRFPALAAVYKNARAVADIRVENALYKRATGYDYEEVTREEGPKGVTVRYVTKHVPPSEVAAFFWLKNRKPHGWKDRKEAQEIELQAKELELKAKKFDLEKQKLDQGIRDDVAININIVGDDNAT